MGNGGSKGGGSGSGNSSNKGNLHYTNEGKRTGVKTNDGYTCTAPSNGLGVCKKNDSNYGFSYDVSKNSASSHDMTSTYSSHYRESYSSTQHNSRGDSSQGSQTAHYSGVRTAIDASSASSTFKSIVEMTSSPQHGRYLLGERIINLKNGNLKNEDIGVLVQYLQYQALNLDLFDISGNVLSFRGVENLFYTFRLGAPAATFNIKCLNLSNNLIADDGAKYIASHLSNGLHPHLKSLDVSGNQITKIGEGYLVKALNVVSQDIMVVLEKYSTDLGQKVIKPALKEFVKYAEKNGVDTTHVATNKSTLEYLKDGGKIGENIVFGIFKCSSKVLQLLTLDFTAPSLTIGYLIEQSGKESLKKANLYTCVIMETYDAVVSPEGVDLAVKGIELIGDN